MAGRPTLRALAGRLGILPDYREAGSGARRSTSDATREALAAAIGVDASSEAAAARALAALDAAARARACEPTRVTRAGSAAARRLALRLPPRADGSAEFELELRLEDGRTLHRRGRTRVGRRRDVLLALGALPVGVHSIRARVRAGGAEIDATQARVVAPARALALRERLGSGRAFGLHANLYAVRSERQWGVGDLGDLAALVRLAASRGAAYVGLSPLHALANRGEGVSPYSPVSRLFRNPLYLDVEAVPEWREDAVARAEADGLLLEALRVSPSIRYEEVARAKHAVLRRLHARFAARARTQGSGRSRAHAAFARAGGGALEAYATWCALAELHGDDARRWPAALRRGDGAAALAFRRERADAVDYHRWLQFELDRQLAAASRAAPLALGLLADLAVGCVPGGADPWILPDRFARGATLGAPPDRYAREGQDWSLAPIRPDGLAADGYALWRALLQAAFAHAGALRIDHAMGLARIWWIPEGRPASEGAYVRMPEDDLLAVLALESRRARAVVVGEDLGTVPAGFTSRLARAGVLSTRVLYFEQRAGRFLPGSRYSPRALAVANNHDLPPLAALLSERDLELRRAAGDLPDAAALAAARAERARERSALAARLRRDGLLAPGAPLTAARLSTAVASFLGRCASPLVGLTLDDLAGEDVPVNLPGIPPARYPSWQRKLGRTLAALQRDAGACAALAAVAEERRASREGGPGQAVKRRARSSSETAFRGTSPRRGKRARRTTSSQA